MKLTPHIQDKDSDNLRVEQIQKKRKEYHLVGQQRKVKGHTLFSFNVETKEIKVAPVNIKCYLDLSGEVLYKRNVTIEKNCIYIQALNKRNVEKKLKKEGYL